MSARAAAPATLLVLLLAAAAAGATTWRVQPDGGGDRPTIQAALDAAGDGDVILLAPGTYTGPGNHELVPDGRAVTLRATGGPAPCVLDAGGATAGRRLLRLGRADGPGLRIEGVTFSGGRLEGDEAPAAAGGAVLCEDAAPVFVACVFTDNLARFGGAVACRGGAPRFVRCEFRGNSAEFGGALWADGGAPRLEDCVVDNNAAFDGGGLACDGGDPIVTGGRITANLAYHGGGLHADGDVRVLVDGTWFQGNFATTGGGVAVFDGELRLVRSLLVDNTAGVGGGVLGGRGAAITLDHVQCVFQHQGGAVAVDAESRVDAACTNIFGNAEGDWTGALAQQAGRDGNRSEAPGFTDPAGGDFSFRPDAPGRRAVDGCDPLVRD